MKFARFKVYRYDRYGSCKYEEYDETIIRCDSISSTDRVDDEHKMYRVWVGEEFYIVDQDSYEDICSRLDV